MKVVVPTRFPFLLGFSLSFLILLLALGPVGDRSGSDIGVPAGPILGGLEDEYDDASVYGEVAPGSPAFVRAEEEPSGSWSDELENETGIETKLGVEVRDGKVEMNHWRYERSIEVNISGGGSEGHLPLLTLNSSVFNYSRAKQGGADLRFRDADGEELSYWIEQWNVKGKSKIWLNASGLAEGTSNITMYYGNSLATPASDGTAVFELFDDFEDEAPGLGRIPSGWKLDEAGDYSYGVSRKDGTTAWWQYVERWHQDPPHGGRARIYKDTGTLNSWVFEGRVLTYNAYGNGAYKGWSVTTFGPPTGVGSFRHVDSKHRCRVGGSGWQPFAWQDNTWYDFRVVYDGTTHRLYFNGVLEASWHHPGDSNGRFYLGSGYFGKNFYDDVRLRQYVPVEPKLTVGKELERPPAHIISTPVQLPENMRRYRLSVEKTEPWGSSINLSVMNAVNGSIPEGYGDVGAYRMNISSLVKNNITTIRLKAVFREENGAAPSLNAWGIEWWARYPERIGNIDDIELFEETPKADILDLKPYFHDIYSDTGSWKYGVDLLSDNENLEVAIDGSMFGVTRLAVNFSGIVRCRIRYTNAFDLSTRTNLFNIKILDLNDPPRWHTSPPEPILEEDGDYTAALPLSQHVRDAENDPLSYNVTRLSGNLSAEVDENHTLKIIPEKDYFGKGLIRIEVSEVFHPDMSAAIELPVTVDPVNDAPRIVASFDNVSFTEDVPGYICLDDIFRDPDDALLIYAAETGSTRIRLNMTENNTLCITPKAEWYGTTDASILAVDPKGSATRFDLTVEIRSTNDIPKAFLKYHSEEVIVGGRIPKLEGYGVDKDGSIVDHKWISSIDGRLGNGSLLGTKAISALSLGRHTLYFSVRDDRDAWSDPATTEVTVKAPFVEIQEFDVGPISDIREGRSVRIRAKLRNTGNAVAENVSLRILIDGERIHRTTFRHLFPNGTAVAATMWKAETGGHNISVEIEGERVKRLPESSGPAAAVKELNVKEGFPTTLLVMTTLLSAVVVIFALYVLLAHLRKRKRKEIISRLSKKTNEVKARGVAVEEIRGLIGEIRTEFL